MPSPTNRFDRLLFVCYYISSSYLIWVVVLEKPRCPRNTPKLTKSMSRLEEIMERLMRLDRRGTRISMRDSFPPGPNRWYITQSVYITGFKYGGFYPLSVSQSGSSPEEAAEKYWKEITNVQDSNRFLCRITCKSDVPIPGDTPQIWVRWNQAKDDWEDVIPTAEALGNHCIPPERVIPYKVQWANDRY
jgi:hypothetical protein